MHIDKNFFFFCQSHINLDFQSDCGAKTDTMHLSVVTCMTVMRIHYINNINNSVFFYIFKGTQIRMRRLKILHQISSCIFI